VFRDITTERLRRGVFTSVPELESAINEYVAHHITNPKPFIWTKGARDTLQKASRANSRQSSKQTETLHSYLFGGTRLPPGLGSLRGVRRLSRKISHEFTPNETVAIR